jgi:hypothetical protein
MKSVMRLLMLMAALGLLSAAPPPWWTTQNILTPNAAANDYAAANLGQVKTIAAKAATEMDRRFPGGAGPAIASLIATWRQPPAPGVVRNDYAAVNQGQLKAVARLFYDRLAELGYQGPPLAPGKKYPWPTATTGANDYAAVNLGQVKYLFSFDPALVRLGTPGDADGNGLPDAWELKYFGHLGVDPNADPDGDGISNLVEYLTGRNPTKGELPDTTGVVNLRVYSPNR